MKRVEYTRGFLAIACYLVFLGSLPLPSLAKTPAPTKLNDATESLYTQASVQAKIGALNARQDLDEQVKAKAIKLYESTLHNLDAQDLLKERTAAFQKSIQDAPEQTKSVQKEMAQFQTRVAKQKPEEFSHIVTEELEQRLILEKEKLSGLEDQLKKLGNEQALQNSRPPLIRSEQLAAQQDIDDSQQKMETLATATASKLEAEAEQAFLKTLMDAKAAELKMLDMEAISNPARVELLKNQYQWLSLQKDAASSVLAAIDSILAERRQQEAKNAQDALNQAQLELGGKHPAIQAITRENIQYSKDLQAINEKIDEYAEQKVRLDAQAAKIDEDFKSAEKKIGLAGLSPALGKILREQRRNLLRGKEFNSLSETIQNETALTSLQQYKVEDKLKNLVDTDTALQALMQAQVDQSLPQDQRMMIQAELRVLLNNQKDLLNKLAVADGAYLRNLGDFDFTLRQMAAQAGKFAAYLDEHLLWVPSSEPINADYPLELLRSCRWLVSPANNLGIVNDSLNALGRRPLLAFACLSIAASLLVSQRRIKRQLSSASEKVGKFYSDRFHHSLTALLCIVLLVLPLPLLAYFWGWFLSNDYHIQDFSKAFGAGLQGASVPLFFLQFFCRLFALNGIAHRHFQWQKDSVQLMHGQLAWLRYVVVPAAFLMQGTGASATASHSDSLGRLALIISMVALALFLRRILNPNSGLLRQTLASYPDGWLKKLRYLWYPAAVLPPLAIIGFAAAGYYLSALELQQKLIISLRLIFLVIVLHQLALRWLTLVNRQLAIENVRQKRRANIHGEKHPMAGSEDFVLPDEHLVDIPKINAQTLKLLAVVISFALILGFWLIWGNILPAFSFLDHIVLWQHEVLVDKQPVMQPITLTNLLLAGLYAFVMVVAVVNFSGFMELLVFRVTTIDAGSRYAINQLAKYLLVAIGLIAIANELGGSWSQVQWLVAALGVGLGFGLQEIFANLVSGIILLFERPIRVGDTVTIGDVTGKVSRIQMRATTIMDWDQKELVVPNKTFITNELVNWTLSDAITRVVIPINIAYGSNVEKAHQVMMDTVCATPLVLSDPEPCVLFMEIGESSLNFSVRVFVSEMGHRLPVIHDLHFRLEKALRENGIEIPFPQRDLHIRSSVAMPIATESKGWQKTSVVG